MKWLILLSNRGQHYLHVPLPSTKINPRLVMVEKQSAFQMNGIEAVVLQGQVPHIVLNRCHDNSSSQNHTTFTVSLSAAPH